MHASQYLKKLQQLNLEKLQQIDGFGPKMIASLQDFISSNRLQKLISSFELLEQSNKGLNLEITPKINLQNQKTVCITGSFDIPRSEIAQILTQKGYGIMDSVTNKTQILLVGEKSGSKLAKAKKLGLDIVLDYNLL